MTRTQFDRHYAASQDTTEGFTDAELEKINDTVFSKVAAVDMDDRATDNHVLHMMELMLRGLIERGQRYDP